MSRFVILFIINLPLLATGLLGTVAKYKTRKISLRACLAGVGLWLLLGVLLVCVEPIYNALIRNNLTNSTPMSLFDIVLLTMVLLCLFLLKKANESITYLNRKISKLHENLAIAEEQRHWDKDGSR